MRLVGRGDLVDEPWFSSAGERSRRAEVLDGAVQKWISARELDEVLEAFEDAGAAIAPIYDVEQLVNDPHVVARDTITTVDDEDLGPLKMQNLIFRLGDTPGGIRWTGRRLGQDNEAVYAELGVDAGRLAELRKKGVV
jgi:crotonobetainyl-CoA:carnitine CoA-transferase CaiB-like acyl-CoA transferase